MLYKAMGRIYKKICYKERHHFYIIGPTLAIINQRIYTHKPLPFGDSFYANVIMKFSKEYDAETEEFYIQMNINAKLIFTKEVPGVKGVI